MFKGANSFVHVISGYVKKKTNLSKPFTLTKINFNFSKTFSKEMKKTRLIRTK
jgi:hypothetical protein